MELILGINRELFRIVIYVRFKWQCVEFARRYWMHHFKVYLPDVPIAAKIWEMEEAFLMPLESGKRVPLMHLENGTVKPEVGDFLIYAKSYEERVGHVAVVVKVFDDKIQIAEQNRHNDRMWPGNYAHEIELIYKSPELPFFMHDKDVSGLLGITRISKL